MPGPYFFFGVRPPGAALVRRRIDATWSDRLVFENSRTKRRQAAALQKELTTQPQL